MVSVATNHATVCFCQARGLALIWVMRRNLCVWRQGTRVSTVDTVAIVRIDIGCVACGRRS